MSLETSIRPTTYQVTHLGNTLSDVLGHVVNSIAELRLLGGTPSDVIYLSGYRSGSNKGSGHFKWDPSNTSPDNSGSVIGSGAAGRWVRSDVTRYTPEMFGADGTKANDPAAIAALLANCKSIAIPPYDYYYDREFVTNGHDIVGCCGEYWNTGRQSKIIFFGGFTTRQAIRNTQFKSSIKGVRFQPESWDATTGYAGDGLRLERTCDFENCTFALFKGYGVDLWEDVANAKVPYYSQFKNCQYVFCGRNGLRLAQGSNVVTVIGGLCAWNGAPSYGVAPTDSSTGWDGLTIDNITWDNIPPIDNPFGLQGLTIEGIDCSYNARYGANLAYCNQSRISIAYSEGNFAINDVNIGDIVACEVNVLVAQKGANVQVPTRGYGATRSEANYPNNIRVNGAGYGTGAKDVNGNYLDYSAPKLGTTLLAAGTAGSTYLRARSEGDGSVEFFADGNVQILYRCPALGALPTASSKWLGVIIRNTSVGPNPLQVCVETAPSVYAWRTITTS